MLEYHKYKYRLNASHSFHNQKEKQHLHTFIIVLCISLIDSDEFVSFHLVDQLIENYISQFSGQYLNEHPVFSDSDASIESIGDILYDIFKKMLKEKNYDLIQLEICDNPLNTYGVSDRILLPTEFMADNIKKWEEILERKRRFMAYRL